MTKNVIRIILLLMVNYAFNTPDTSDVLPSMSFKIMFVWNRSSTHLPSFHNVVIDMMLTATPPSTITLHFVVDELQDPLAYVLKNFYINLICSIFAYVYIYNKSRVIGTRANVPHYGLQPISGLQEFLNQLNLLYICICLYLQ
jgi:hypothetical protein